MHLIIFLSSHCIHLFFFFEKLVIQMVERGRKIERTKIGGVCGEQLLPIPLILSLALLLVFVHALPCERLETNWC